MAPSPSGAGEDAKEEPTQVVGPLGIGGFSAEPAPAGQRRQRTTAAMLGVAVLVLLALLGGYLATRALMQDSGGGGARPSGTSAPAPLKPGSVPAGFTRYRHSGGFSVAVPEGWQPDPRPRGVVDVREPQSTRFLRLIRTAGGTDPKVLLAAAEPSFAQSHDGYQRIRLDSVSYRGYDAADWEFTYSNKGERRHVLYRAFVVDGAGYAIYLSVPDQQWPASRRVFEVAASTFDAG